MLLPLLIGRVGGSCPAITVSLHALTAKHNKTATMATSQGNSKIAFSNWKYRYYFSLILIKGNNVSVTCTLCPGKTLYQGPSSPCGEPQVGPPFHRPFPYLKSGEHGGCVSYLEPSVCPTFHVSRVKPVSMSRFAHLPLNPLLSPVLVMGVLPTWCVASSAPGGGALVCTTVLTGRVMGLRSALGFLPGLFWISHLSRTFLASIQTSQVVHLVPDLEEGVLSCFTSLLCHICTI